MIILYLIESSLYLLLGWALYAYAFRERGWFRFSRLFLLSWIPISLLAPLIPWTTLWTVSGGEYIVYLEEITVGSGTQIATNPASGEVALFSWIWALMGILYLIGVIYKVLQWMRGHQSIFQLKSKASLWEKNTAENIKIYRWPGSMPFSYGRSIFIPKSMAVDSPEYQMALNHEKVHVQEMHYIDKVYYHLWTVVIWFHPFVYMMRQAQEEVHELEADRKVTQQFQKQDYMHFLLHEVQGIPMPAPHFVSPFFTSPLKKRIQMIAGQTQSQSQTTISLLLGLFFIAGLTVIGCESDVTDNVKEVEQHVEPVYYLDGMRKDEAQEPPPPPPPPSPEALKSVNSMPSTTANGLAIKGDLGEKMKNPEPLLSKLSDKLSLHSEISSSSPTYFKIVESMPRFPGCENKSLSDQERKKCAQQKLLEFVYDNIRYPETAKSKNISGMVVVKFVVDHEGRVQNPEIVRDIGGGCGEEAVRVVNLMNEQNIRWVSGQHRGKNVSVQFHLPIKFQLK